MKGFTCDDCGSGRGRMVITTKGNRIHRNILCEKCDRMHSRGTITFNEVLDRIGTRKIKRYLEEKENK